MNYLFLPILIYVNLGYLCKITDAIPITNNAALESQFYPGITFVILGLGTLCSLVIGLVFCTCCLGRSKHKRGPQFSHFDELIVFPSSVSSTVSESQEQVTFEPLPDISHKLRTSKVHENQQSHAVSADSPSKAEIWFAEPFKNFPRTQLQYLKKLGSGWFGNVLEGRAIGIDSDHTSSVITAEEKFTPVVVKCLREDAQIKEQAYFLQELLPYRNLNHNNVLKLLAYCLDTQPLLVLLQYCSKGNLKSLLRRENLSEETRLKMLHGLSQGLLHMHENSFIHTDLAARNCLVTEDYEVKIGDYGFSIEAYPEEYYLTDNVALPLRWCAPESLNCTESTIETVQLTETANVWSFGVLMWEVFSNEIIPYSSLSNDEVIQKVILHDQSRLSLATIQSNKNFDDVLNLCWMIPKLRPDMKHINTLLSHLQTRDYSDFDERWDNLSSGQSKNFSICSYQTKDGSLQFESDFKPLSTNVPFNSPSNHEPDQPGDSLTEEISQVIQQLEEALAEESTNTSQESPPETNLKSSATPLSSLCLEDEANLTIRLEQEDFSRLVKAKSMSVQNLMCLTVVDDESDKTSQYGSLPTEPLSVDKSFCSESNLNDAVRDVEFMQELESFQAEQKLSLITEDSGNETLSCVQTSNDGSDKVDNDKPVGEDSLKSSVNSNSDFLEQGNLSTERLDEGDLSTNDNVQEEINSNFYENNEEQNQLFDVSGDVDSDAPLESGQFWKDQMAAWQEAAEQTRELLKEAATFAEDNDSDAQFNEEELDALRLELNLKLPGSPKQDYDNNQEVSDNIVVNYDSRPVKLSPISEEVFEENSDSLDMEYIQDDQTQFNFQDVLGEEPASLILEDFDNDSITCLPESNKNAGCDDFLLVDTETNAAAIINWSSPRLAFVTEKTPSYEAISKSPSLIDDEDYESHPYASAPSSLSSVQTPRQNPSKNDHYESYFHSGVTKPVIDKRPIYESCDHASLPYNVNYLDISGDERQTNSLNFISTNEKSDYWSSKETSIDTDNQNQKPSSISPVTCPENDGSSITTEDQVVSEVEENIKEEIVTEDASPNEKVDSPAYTLPDLTQDNKLDANYAPDWESDEDSSTDSSSTSGEFVWLPNGPEETASQCLPEKQSKYESNDISCSDHESSESGEEEFTPSIWNRELTPQRSLLKSPEMESLKKRVRWKRQRHHRVYEYPPEPSAWHSEQPTRRTWGSKSLDYFTLADHQLFDGLYVEDTNNYDDLAASNQPHNVAPSLYAMSPFFSQPTTDGMLVDDGEFYIRSSGTPFSFNGSSFTPTEFFSNVPTASDTTVLENENLFIKENTIDNGNLLANRDSIKVAKESLKLDIHPVHLDQDISTPVDK